MEAMLLKEKEKRLVEIIREIGYGEMQIIIQDGLPIRIVRIEKSIKL